MTGPTLRAKAAYAAPGFAFALVGIPVYVHLPKFYGDALGVDLAAIGAIILASRLWDAISDPAVGFLSDRTRTRIGRRRPWILAAALPLAASTAGLLAPPPGLAAGSLTWWFAGMLFVTFLAWTCVQIPHAALGPELSPDHHGRTSLFAARDGLWILGTLAAAGAPGVIRAMMDVPPSAEAEREVFRRLAVLYAPVLALLPLWCVVALREPAPAARGPETPFGATTEALANRPFRVLLVAYGIGALGAALPATLILFYVEHVLRAPALADAFLALYFLSGFAFLPAWTHLARRIGKLRAWLLAMSVNVGAFVFACFLGPGDTLAYGVVCVVSGVGFGAGLVLPNSLVADVVDYDELRTGRRREGLYFGLWSVVTKVSAAVGASVALPALQWAGYVPQLAVQDEGTLLTLRALYAAVPCACYGAGMLVAARFPIDADVHLGIKQALAQRASGAQWRDPLAEGLR